MTGQKPEQHVDKPRKAKGCRQTMGSQGETIGRALSCRCQRGHSPADRDCGPSASSVPLGPPGGGGGVLQGAGQEVRTVRGTGCHPLSSPENTLLRARVSHLS